MQSKCPVCGIKKSRFVKEQEAKGLLSDLGIKTSLSKIPLLNVLFWMQFHWEWKWMKLWISFCLWEIYARNSFKTTWFYLQCLRSIHKKQRKNRKVYTNWKYRFYYRNELDKACFQHDMAYGKTKDLVKEHNQIKF